MTLDEKADAFISYFTERFGVKREHLGDVVIFSRGKSVYVTTAKDAEMLLGKRHEYIGLRAGRLLPGGWKPTTDFLNTMSSRLTKNVVVAGEENILAAIRRGERLVDFETVGETTEGFVAVKTSTGLFLCCGFLKSGGVELMLPKNRKSALVGARK